MKESIAFHKGIRRVLKAAYRRVPEPSRLGLIRQCLEIVRYMLPAALEYPPGD